MGKGNWFVRKKAKETPLKQRKQVLKEEKKEKEKEKDFTSVLFVNQTPNGVLAKKLQKVENDISKLTGDRVKIVERGGTTLKRMLVKSNPWAGSFCGRDNCLPCMSSDGDQDCFLKGVVNDMTCTKCEEEANERKDVNVPIYRYTGTTSRSLYERGAEHLKAFKDKDIEKSVLLKHSHDKHEGNFVQFSMKIIKKHYSAFQRLVHEAVRIERNSRDKNISSLNSKSEYGRGHLPRLIINEPENVKVDRGGDLKVDSLEVNDTVEEDIKLKEKLDEGVKDDGSEGGPSKNLVDNFNALHTAAENKPNHYNYRQKIAMTKHISFSKVRKRRHS